MVTKGQHERPLWGDGAVIHNSAGPYSENKLYEKNVSASSVGTLAIHPGYNYNLQNIHQYSIHEN